MTPAPIVKTVRNGALSLNIFRYADGRFGFDDKRPHAAKRTKIRLHQLQDAVARAESFIAAGQGGKLDLLAIDEISYREYLAWRSTRRSASLIPELVADFVATKERKGVSWQMQKGLKLTLGKFAKAFPGAISELARSNVEAWLDSLEVGPRTWNNYLSDIVGLHKFARREGALSEGLTPVERIEKKITIARIETYSPEELTRLLMVVPLEWRPAIVLGAFVGLRPEEICPQLQSKKPALLWENILWEKAQVDVPKAVSKVRQRRFVPFCAAAMAFLKPWRNGSGPVVPRMKMYRLTPEWAARSGVKWKPDGLRHSYASYRLAVIKDIGRLATEMGNSPKIIHEHYLELKHEDEAERWFGIRPDDIIEASLGEAPETQSSMASEKGVARAARAARRFRLGMQPTQTDAAEQVIRELGRPLTRIELAKLVIEKGATVSNIKSFIAVLSRDERFVCSANKYWDLRERQRAQ